MIEVAPRLYVGNELDWQTKVRDGRSQHPRGGWAVLHACKHPHHRDFVGQPDPRSPNYLVAEVGRRMALNMVDVPDRRYFSTKMMNAGLNFIAFHIGNNEKVLVQCNQGGSRAPGLALLYLRQRANGFRDLMYDEAEDAFRRVYPNYMPGGGIRGYLVEHWNDALEH